jgi:hypothetical protein
MVETPLLLTAALPGWNQNVSSTSQMPASAVRRACSGPGPRATAALVDRIGGSVEPVLTTMAPTITSGAVR